MFKEKKSQGAIEFMLILLFVLGLISGIMYLTGTYLVEAKQIEQQNRAANFAENINKELEILAKVEEGYSRSMVLNNDDYVVEVYGSKLKIYDSLNDETYYFDMTGNYNVSIFNVTNEFDQNVTMLSFDKAILI